MNTLGWILSGALAVASLFYSWTKRGQRIASLKTQLKIQPGQIEIDRLTEEANEKSKNTDVANQDFNALLDSNPELAAKLGLRPRPDTPRD